MAGRLELSGPTHPRPPVVLPPAGGPPPRSASPGPGRGRSAEGRRLGGPNACGRRRRPPRREGRKRGGRAGSGTIRRRMEEDPRGRVAEEGPPPRQAAAADRAPAPKTGTRRARGRRAGPRQGARASEKPKANPTEHRPQVGREDPLDLSISLSGGKETNQDSPSSGERSGKSPAPNPRAPAGAREVWREEVRVPAEPRRRSPLERGCRSSGAGVRPMRARGEAGAGPPGVGLFCNAAQRRVVNSIQG